MSFGKVLILIQLVLGAVFGLIAYVLNVLHNESGFAVFLALSVIFTLTGLITATTFPQFARRIEENSADQ